MEPINPLTFAFIRNDPFIPATIGSCVLQTHQEIRPRPHFPADDCGLIRNSPQESVSMCVTWALQAQRFLQFLTNCFEIYKCFYEFRILCMCFFSNFYPFVVAFDSWNTLFSSSDTSNVKRYCIPCCFVFLELLVSVKLKYQKTNTKW